MVTDVIIRESHSRLVHSYHRAGSKKKKKHAELLVKRKVVSRINLVHLIYNNIPISPKTSKHVQMAETVALCLQPCTKNNIYFFFGLLRGQFVCQTFHKFGRKQKQISREAKWDVITDVRHPVVTSQRDRLNGSGACPNPKKFKVTFLILEE